MLTGRIFRNGLIAVLIMAARVASAQGTTTFLSNLGQSSAGSVSVGSDSWIAASFRTGTNSGGYFLNSIQLGIADATGTPIDFTVMLFDNQNPSGYIPGDSLATFMGSLGPTGSGMYSYSAPNGLVLSSLAIYSIVITADTPTATGAYQWSYAGSTSYSPNSGWITGGIEQSTNGGSSWRAISYEPLQFALIGSVAPEPGVVGLLVVGGVVLAEGVRRRARGARACQMRSGTTKT